MCQLKLLCASSRRYLPLKPKVNVMLQLIRTLFTWRSKPLAAGQRGVNSFSLTLTYERAFRFCYIAQELQNNIRYKRPRQVTVGSGIQQRHVEHNDGGAFLFGDDPPLIQDVRVVPSQPIDALYNQYISGLEHTEHLLIRRTVEVLPALLVGDSDAAGPLARSFRATSPEF